MLLAIAAALAAAPSADVGALAGGALSATEELRVRWWQVPDVLENFEDRPILDYVEVVQRLDVQGGSARWGAGARVDAVALFANRYILDGVLTHERDLLSAGLASPFPDAYVVAEKLWLEARGPVGQLTAGDSYTSFGRGLALNLVKNTDIDIDTSIRGVRAVARAGDWEVTAVSGLTNPQQVALENPNLALVPDDQHAISAARVERRAVGPFNLGAHATLVQFQPSQPPTVLAYQSPVGAAVYGGTVEAYGLGGLDWFVEVDGFHYDDANIAVKGGHAVYASASAYTARHALLVEFRRAWNAEYVNALSRGYEITSGPTLEYDRVITEDSSAAVNSNAITGGRVRLDLSYGEGVDSTVPYVSMAAFRDEDLGALHFNRAPETILHPVAGVQWFAGELHLLANAGFRADIRDAGPAGEALGADRVVHADAAFAVPLGHTLSMELTPAVLSFAWGNNAQQQTNYLDFSNALALKLGSPWILVLYTDHSTNPLIRSTGNISDAVYGGAEVQWKPTPAMTAKVFYGAYRAGIRCAAGQCRSLPGFEGLKVGFSGTF